LVVELLVDQFAKPLVQAERGSVDFLVVFDKANVAKVFRHEQRIDPENSDGNTVNGKQYPANDG
jgi:hypothetical protein